MAELQELLFTKHLKDFDSYIRFRSRMAKFKTPLYNQAEDVAQMIRIKLWRRYPYFLTKWRGSFSMWGKVLIRCLFWEIAHKDKREILYHNDGLGRRRDTLDSQFERAKSKAKGGDSEGGDNYYENLGDENRWLKDLICEIDFKRALVLANIKIEYLEILYLRSLGYKIKEIAEAKKTTKGRVRGILERVRAKITKSGFNCRLELTPEQMEKRNQRICQLYFFNKVPIVKIQEQYGFKNRIYQILNASK
ncbi:MAG: hypothetical protein ACKKMW_02035 [Candidatus Nealsonbacteria bacterium]